MDRPPLSNGTPQPFTWRVGEHVAVVGDTGTGKTYLIARLVRQRQYVVILRTKPDDIKFEGFRRATKASAMDSPRNQRILLAPRHEHQQREAIEMLNRVWEQHGWTAVVDELWYLSDMLKLGPWVDRLLTQGRSVGISMVVGMQRPARISRFAISQCTHLFVFRVEGRDMQIIKESTTPNIVAPIENLTGHEFVYYHRGKREIRVGTAQELESILHRPMPKSPPTT